MVNIPMVDVAGEVVADGRVFAMGASVSRQSWDAGTVVGEFMVRQVREAVARKASQETGLSVDPATVTVSGPFFYTMSLDDE